MPALEAPRLAGRHRRWRVDRDGGEIQCQASGRPLDDVGDGVVAADVAGQTDDALAPRRVEEALRLAREEVAELPGR